METDREVKLREIARARCDGAEPAHDFQHVLRVAANARAIGDAEGARTGIAVAAALLHELFNYPKDHPDSARSGDVCAEHALVVLREQQWPEVDAQAVAYCIRVHSFSRGLPAETLEAQVLQDADRLDAIGAIGVARCFATCAAMKRPFYDPADPLCETRPPDDKQWGVDHFFKKLLKIPTTLNTATGRAMAEERARYMDGYLRQLKAEIDASAPASARSSRS
jgi:uncharacterized protein